MDLNNTKVLVTGADGFIGSHLTEMLMQKGARVRALSYYNSFNHWGWLDEIPCLKEVEVLSGDVRDPHFCMKAIKGCDIVFHLAALIAIPYSYAAPSSYVDTNVTGTLNICQAALESGCKRVIHTSTSEVYGTAQYVPIDEKHPLQPQSPYSATKIGADMVARSFFLSFGLPVITVRPFNTYGPRQSARAVIPNIISQIAARKSEIRIGDLNPTRDFNYVADTCRGFVQLAECDAAVGETVNVGSGREVAIGDLLSMIQSQMASSIPVVEEAQRLRPKNSEVQRLLCDNQKIRALTGFTPEVPLVEGLRRTIEWFSEPKNLQRYKTDLYNV